MRRLITALILALTLSTAVQAQHYTSRQNAFIELRQMADWTTTDTLLVYFASPTDTLNDGTRVGVDQVNVRDLKETVLNATTVWADALDKNVVVTNSFAKANIVVLARHLVARDGGPNTRTLAFVDTRLFEDGGTRRRKVMLNINLNIQFSNNRAPRTFDFPTVVLHELGHAFGLTHSRDRNDLMYPSVGHGIIKYASPNDIDRMRRNYYRALSVKRGWLVDPNNHYYDLPVPGAPPRP